LAASLVGTAPAATRLSDRQLDKVTAGSIALPPTPSWWPFPYPPLPLPGSLPPINPGGPVLISCVIGSGCTVRPA
jgi:hypothetical protein